MALLVALALSNPAFAQSTADRVSLNAAIGPSFANLGTTLSTTDDLALELNDHATLIGEFGFLRRAPFGEASEIAVPLATPGSESPPVNAYHSNVNLKVRICAGH